MSDISKLPKWAQAEIERLNADVRYLEEKIAALSSDSSKVYARITWERNLHLPTESVVTFVVGDHEIDVRLSEVGGSHLEVQCHGRVSVEPRASNCFDVRPR